MHLGKFHFVVWELRNYYTKNKLVAHLDQLIAQLGQYSSTSTTENATAFRVVLDTFFEQSRLTPPDKHTKIFQDVLLETEGEFYFGKGIEIAVSEIIKSTYTPSEQHVKLNEYATKFRNYVQVTVGLAEALDELGVEYETLEKNHFEFAALLPKELVGVLVSDLHAELQHLDRFFKTLNELMGRGATSPTVKTISSSWWQIFLDLDSTQIAAATFALERIVALYKQNLEIRKLKRDAEKNDIGEEVTQLLDKKIEEKLKSGMEKIANEIRENYSSNNDSARCNELETQLRMELVHIAKRINQGATYEVRASIPAEPKGLKDAEKEDPALVEKYEKDIEEYKNGFALAEDINSAQYLMTETLKEVSGDSVLLTDYEKLAEAKPV